MTSDVIERTSLWKKALATRDGDSNEKNRGEFRNAFWRMRSNVIPFVSDIHKDLPGLTVHNETHLDALWETADIIAGPDFELTPTEAFTFGAAVLLHDTAMALSAYPGGLEELRGLQLWKDIEAQYGSANGKRIQFLVLRELHAQQAEQLAKISFLRKGSKETLFLLDDTPIRDCLAQSIGKIAHSHHWDSRDLLERLNQKAGGVPGNPTEWTLNEVKVACLLRCADAAHIDSRRAPTMLYAISDIQGASEEHWDFQNKLNQIAIDHDKLVFSSGQSFDLDSASAWWLGYDTLRMIDKELKNSNAILEDIGLSSFQARGILGIESPRLLSRHLRVENWTPVDAEVRVSDPVHLAKTLGGENLYGSHAIPPLRELLQNCADAIRARRLLEGRSGDWGCIRITLEANEAGDTLLHIDDQGVGMSERVLTGPLIDFGSSLWTMDLVRQEFPGLLSKKPRPIGKFGIGFFSVFLLGDFVEVISKRFDKGRDDERVLVFDHLSRRPLVRPSVTGELPQDFSTRVTVKLFDNHVNAKPPTERYEFAKIIRRTRGYSFKHDLDKEIRSMICSLDVNVLFEDNINNVSWRHSSNWTDVQPDIFLLELNATRGEKVVDDVATRLRVIRNGDGKAIGRAAYAFAEDRYSTSRPFVSVGGFSTYQELMPSDRIAAYTEKTSDTVFPPMIGVVEGSTSDTIRSYAATSISQDSIVKWATEQSQLFDVNKYLEQDLVRVCVDLMEAGAEVENLPFGIISGKFQSWSEFVNICRKHREIIIPIDIKKYSNSFTFESISQVPPFFLSSKTKENIALIFVRNTDLDFIDKDLFQKICDDKSYDLSEFFVKNIINEYSLKKIYDLCISMWKSVNVSIERVDLKAEGVYSDAGKQWGIRFHEE